MCSEQRLSKVCLLSLAILNPSNEDLTTIDSEIEGKRVVIEKEEEKFPYNPNINYTFDLINYVSLLLSSKTIANSPEYCLDTSVMNTYCVNKRGFHFFSYLSLAFIPPFFPQPLSPVLPQFPFSFFPWPSARFEPTLLFSSGVPVCLPYH